MKLTTQHHELASQIDNYVKNIWSAGGGDEQILLGMHGHLMSFKQLMDISKNGEFDVLCTQYDGFYKFAKVLEDMAKGIKDGTIKVP